MSGAPRKEIGRPATGSGFEDLALALFRKVWQDSNARLFGRSGQEQYGIGVAPVSWTVAERGSMRLHECDAHLEWARLCRQRGEWEEAKRHLEVARRIVEETGYGRRRREVEWLERQLA